MTTQLSTVGSRSVLRTERRLGHPRAVDHRVLHERYVDELGLLTPVVTGTAERWEVRVDRQLVHPADVVRAVLDGVPGRWELVDGTGHGAAAPRPHRGGCSGGGTEQPAAVTALVDRLADRP